MQISYVTDKGGFCLIFWTNGWRETPRSLRLSGETLPQSTQIVQKFFASWRLRG